MGKKVNNIEVVLNQINISPGNISENASTILRCIKKYQTSQIDLLVFPELSTTGYLLGDTWERTSFLKENDFWVKKIIKATGNAVTVFGTVVTDWKTKGEDGRPRKYNSLIVARAGKVLVNPATGQDYFCKTLLPDYREFEESRHFYDLRKLAYEKKKPVEKLLLPLKIEGEKGYYKLGLTICEDGWGGDYGLHPFKILADKGADVIVNASCSPFTSGKNSKRNRIFSQQTKKLKTPLIYVNAVGLQNNGKTIYTFDGKSTVYTASGKISFEADSYTTKIYQHRLFLSAGNPDRESFRQPDKYSEMYAALNFAAREYLKQCGMNRVVIGISGGIDSALTAAIYSSFLKPGNMLLVTMPSKFNSKRTLSLAKKLAKNIGCCFVELPIQQDITNFSQKLNSLKGENLNTGKKVHFRLKEHDIQNLQSRERGSRILATLASAFNGVFTCNANKSELTVGYSTLYGDLGGYFSLLGDLWKEDVYGLSEYINKKIFKKQIIPKGIMDLPPSAELSEDHNIEEGKGDPLHYPYHDKLFFSWVQKWNRLTPEEILGAYSKGTLEKTLGCEDVVLNKLFKNKKDFIQDLEKWWDLYNGLAAAKRVQAPPVLAVSSRAFGFDHREPVGRAYYTERYQRLKEKLLQEE